MTICQIIGGGHNTPVIKYAWMQISILINSEHCSTVSHQGAYGSISDTLSMSSVEGPWHDQLEMLIKHTTAYCESSAASVLSSSFLNDNRVCRSQPDSGQFDHV